MSEDWSTDLQKKVYTIWANNILKQRNMAFVDMIEDFVDGVNLINILEVLTNDTINHINRPKNRFQQLSNVQLALNLVDRYGINLVNFRPENLVDKHTKMTLALVWRIISKFHIHQYLCDDDFDGSDWIESAASSDGATLTTSSRRASSNVDIYKTSQRGNMLTVREALLRWCRRELESYQIAPTITNFTKSFQSAQVFASLIHKQVPQHIDLEEIAKMDDISALKRCFEIAEKQLGIPQLLTPQNIVDGILDESCTMMYVAYFLNHQKANNPNIINSDGYRSTYSRGHNRTSSTGSNTSTSSVDGTPRSVQPPIPPNTLNSSSDRHIKRPAAIPKRSDPITTTPDKNNFITPTSSPMIHDRHQHSIQSPKNHNDGSNSSTIDKLSLMEILQNFTTELRRITTEHEEMLNKTAAKLDERVNRLGDKLDQLEIKISVIKNVVVSVSNDQNINNNHHHHHQQQGDMIDQQQQDSNPTTPPITTTTTTSTTSTPSEKKEKRKSKKNETREERDERREKRRSRRKEREEKRRIQNGTIDSSAASTMTLSSSSCSLADDAQVDREELKKIIKVQSLARGYLARRAYKRIKTRRDVAQEIFNSEKTYIHNLHILLHDYLVPLRKMCEGSTAINPDNVKSLYNNIEVILNINNSLLKRVQERMSTRWHYEQLFGDIFFKMTDLLKCYIAFVNHYSRSLTTVNDFSKNSTFNEFLNATFQRTNQQLRDLIIIPVQRIPRYVLLLEEMVKVTPSSHPDHAQLVGSLAKMHTIADTVNEKRREFENVTHVSLLQDSIIGFNIMEYPSLRYIMEGDLQIHMSSSGSGFGVVTGTLSNAVTGTSSDLKNNSGVMALQNLHVFLFNQMLVICKYKKGKESYFSKFGSSSSSSDRKSKQPKYKFIFCYNLTCDTKLSHNKSEAWFGVDNANEYKRFMAKGVAEKDMWIQHIQSCITKMAENKKSKNIV